MVRMWLDPTRNDGSSAASFDGGGSIAVRFRGVRRLIRSGCSLPKILLQRSRGTTVAPVYTELWRRWSDAAALSRARVDSIRAVIRPLGLLRRAETLKAARR